VTSEFEATPVALLILSKKSSFYLYIANNSGKVTRLADYEQLDDVGNVPTVTLTKQCGHQF